MTVEVIKSSTVKALNEANNLIPASCQLVRWCQVLHFLFGRAIYHDGEFRSRDSIMANEANFSLGHFTFLAYIYGNSVILPPIPWKGRGFNHKSRKF
jgi:hypothetical protein